MLTVFSTREIASAVYIVVLLIWLCSRPHGFKSVLNLLKSTCKPIILLPILFLFIYAAVIIYGLQVLPLWEWVLIKDVILWVLFVATPIFFKAGTRKLDTYPFSRMVLDNFLLSAFLEFFIGTFTFSLGAELIVIPVFTFITVLKDFNRKNTPKEHLKVYDGIAVVAGAVLFFCTVKVAIDVISSEGLISTLVSFSIPVIFSVAFLPVIYLLAVWAQYHDLFVRLYIRNHISKQGLFIKKINVFLACGLSYKKLLSFRKSYTDYIASTCSANDNEDFFVFVKSFKKRNY